MLSGRERDFPDTILDLLRAAPVLKTTLPREFQFRIFGNPNRRDSVYEAERIEAGDEE